MSELTSLATAEARAVEILGENGKSELLGLLKHGDISAIAGKYVVDLFKFPESANIETSYNKAVPSWFWKEYEQKYLGLEHHSLNFDEDRFYLEGDPSDGEENSEDGIRIYTMHDVNIDIEQLESILPQEKYNNTPIKDIYISPFITIMFDAVRHFNIEPRMKKPPKKEELVEYFAGRKLSDGTPISANHAWYLATFCRPPEAMKGGNKPMG